MGLVMRQRGIPPMEPQKPGRSRRPEIVAAVIRPCRVPPADFRYEAVRITDPATANRLAGFFDAYWSGPPSHTGIGAVAQFAIEFIDRAGERHEVLLTPALRSGLRWCMTRGRGDWPLDPAFGGFFRTLIA